MEQVERHHKPRPGRPRGFDEHLVRGQVMMPESWRDEAERLVLTGKAKSISEVYRVWMERGREAA